MKEPIARLGILALPASGVLFTIANLGPVYADPAFAQAAVTSSFLIANILGLIGVVLAIFGLQAVYFVVKGTAGERWALSGMVFSTAGVSFFLPFLGIFTFAAPIVERMYLSGQGDSVDVIAGPSAHPIFPPWSLAACPYCSSSWARYF